MTNKLPVEGKRYRDKKGVVGEFVAHINYYQFVDDKGEAYEIKPTFFCDEFEELPESNPQEVGEVDRALEAEKDMSKPKPKTDMKEEHVKPMSIWNGIDKLSRAPEPKIDIPVSIWKPVWEKPKQIDHQFIRFDDGDILLGKYDPNAEEHGIKGLWFNLSKAREDALNTNRIKYWMTLTDFINSFEQMQKDIEELKRKR